MSFCAGLIPLAAAAQERPTIPQLLDSYAAGNHSETADALSLVLTSKEVMAAFRERLGGHLSTGPAMVGAAFALEAAAVSFDVDMLGAQQLVDLGRRQLGRAGVSRRFELTWHLAASALLQGPPTLGSLRVEAPGLNNDWPSGRVSGSTGLIEQTNQALRRFPDQPDLLYALGLAHEQVLHGALYTRGFVMANPNRNPYQLTGNGVVRYVGWDSDASVLSRPAADAVNAFARITGPSELARLALLHIGRIRAHQRRSEDARRSWDAVSFPDGSDGAYLLRIFQGRALWLEGRASEAGREFERALEWRPDAQSALASSVALLLLGNQRDRAAALADRTLASRTGLHDPWMTYFRGQYEEWPQRLARLRAELR